MTRILISAVLSCALSGIFGYFLMPVLHALKAGMKIRNIGPTWHNNKVGTPVMGGLMFIGAALVVLLVNIGSMENYSVFYVFLMAASFGAIGMVDDFAKIKHNENLGLTAMQKMLFQMAVSALFVYVMYKQNHLECNLYIPFVNQTIELHPLIYVVFTMFVVVGCVNAVNLTDGVDGLSSSVTLPVMIFFAASAIAAGKMELALLPAALVGGLIAYLFYNWHPAKVFMGDTGSLFLGGAVCALAIALEMPLILIFVGFVYICETLSVILQVSYFKLTHGKRLFKMSPIHHHFEMCGWKEEKIVLTFAAVSAIMCIIAWFGAAGMR